MIATIDTLTRYNAAIARGVRLSGSADEAEAFASIAHRCRSFGMTVREYAIDASVSCSRNRPMVASISYR